MSFAGEFILFALAVKLSLVMRVARSRDELDTRDGHWGLIPTMGALHAGHLSLVAAARAQCDHVAVSIFVNPLQFNDPQDYQNYPKDWEHDLEVLQEAGVDLVYIPSENEFYPADFVSRVELSGPLVELWEGAQRPGHFTGVATVLTKLFHALKPELAFFGQKDFQQLRVVEQMVRDLEFAVKIVGVATVREPDGLALSSRNVFLDPAARQDAALIFRSLSTVVHAASRGTSVAAGLAMGLEVLAQGPTLQPEYLAVVDRVSLRPLNDWVAGARVIAAVRVNTALARGVRLIDNMEIQQ